MPGGDICRVWGREPCRSRPAAEWIRHFVGRRGSPRTSPTTVGGQLAYRSARRGTGRTPDSQRQPRGAPPEADSRREDMDAHGEGSRLNPVLVRPCRQRPIAAAGELPRGPARQGHPIRGFFPARSGRAPILELSASLADGSTERSLPLIDAVEGVAQQQ